MRLEEITPLALQKLLILSGYILCINEKPLFSEQCQAWVHGPVFPEVYELFRNLNIIR
ncbi:Panacea domain-containing protein [Amygdalobacter indicium]|uniref:Panacea domain-containing protein n=1 Tax=Amygdalobacter indicium TaxID=3029272 RepID=UPI0036F1CC57